jgi:hypothetical protein
LQREAEEEIIVIKQREEEDALLAAKIANETRNRLVFKKDGGYSKEHKNGIDRFVKKDKTSVPDRSLSSSSPSLQAPVPSTSSSSSSPSKIRDRIINGQEFLNPLSGHIIRAESKPFNSSVRLSSSSVPGTAFNSLNKRNKALTSQASSCAPRNGIPSFFVRGPVTGVPSSSGAHSTSSGDTICGDNTVFLDRDFHDLVSDDDDGSCPATDIAEASHADTVRDRDRAAKWDGERHGIIEIDVEPSSSHRDVTETACLDAVDTGQKKRGRERGGETGQQDGDGHGYGTKKLSGGASRAGEHAVNRQVRRGLGSNTQNQSNDGPTSQHQVDCGPAIERSCSQVVLALPLPSKWSCTACTYQNLSPLMNCEICDTKRSH